MAWFLGGWGPTQNFFFVSPGRRSEMDYISQPGGIVKWTVHFTCGRKTIFFFAGRRSALKWTVNSTGVPEKA